MASYAAPNSMIEDAELVVSELLANAVEHGRADGVEVVLCRRTPQCWEIEVTGGSASLWVGPRSADAWELSDAGSVSGRGLGLVRRLMSDIDVSDVKGLIRVTGSLRDGCESGSDRRTEQ